MAFRVSSTWWIQHYGKPCLTGDHVRLEWYPGVTTIVHRGTERIWQAMGAVMVAYGYQVPTSYTGSYSCRQITGGGSWSGHAWPVAMDINAKTNPYIRTPTLRKIRWGVDTDMPAAMVAEIESITASGVRAFGWGGRWKRIKDAMHYQIRVSLSEIADGVEAPRGFYEGDDNMAWADIYRKWTAADITAMHSKGLFAGDPAYYIDDIGTYAHSSDWDNLTQVVLAGDAALPQAAGGIHDHDIAAGKTGVSG